MKRIGIVGVGGMGTWHAARWRQLPVELAGFYDASPGAAEKAVTQFGGRAFASLGDLLAAVDVVDVCTPTPHHKAPVLAGAAAGKDIVCEKPLARHLRDAQDMVTACQAAGVRLFVAQVVRFFREFSQAKAILDSGALGRPGVIRMVRGGSPPSVPPSGGDGKEGPPSGGDRKEGPPSGERSWFADLEQSGGVIMDVSIHDVDFARWCLGDVERVFARGLDSAGYPPYGHALILLRFKNGAIGHIEGSWAYPPGRFRTLFEIACDQGLVEFDSLAPAPLTVTMKMNNGAMNNEQAVGVPVPESPLYPTDDPYYRELEHFLNCLEHGDEFLVSARDGLEAVKISLAAIESMRTGRPVDLDEFEE